MSNECRAYTTLPKSEKKNWLIRRIHILIWIKDYNKNIALSDFIAGITLGLTIIPQSIAYASLAGLPTQYGLYAAFMGAFVYTIFGSIKEVSIGPTSLMALLTLQYTYDKPPEFAIILAFLSGIVEIAMGLLNIGFLIDLISYPVTSAFTSATAVIVIVSQLKNLFGIKISPRDIATTIYQVVMNLKKSNIFDLFLGFLCIIFLLLLKQINSIKINKSRTCLKKLIWYISISRNVIIVVVTSFIAYMLKVKFDFTKITLSGNVEPGIPLFELPPFTIVHDGVTFGFLNIIKELGAGIIIVPIVGMLANVAIGKAFATNGNLDASQEMFALGLCNLIGSFFKGIPTCGAFSRSAVSNASGVRTPMAGIYSGAMVLLALSLFTPYFQYIPRTTLAAVLICAVIFMIDLKIVVKLFKESKPDLIAWIICFGSCLAIGVEIGLLCGIVTSFIFVLIKLIRPTVEVKLVEQFEHMKYIYIKSHSDIYYTAIELLRNKVLESSLVTNFQYPVVIDCSKISLSNYTSIKTMKLLCNELSAQNVLVILQNMNENYHFLFNEEKNIQFCDETPQFKNFVMLTCSELCIKK